VGAAVLLGIQFGSVAARQASALAQSFPSTIQGAVTDWRNAHTGNESLDALKQQAIDGLQTQLAGLVSALPSAQQRRFGGQQPDLPGHHPVLAFFF